MTLSNIMNFSMFLNRLPNSSSYFVCFCEVMGRSTVDNIDQAAYIDLCSNHDQMGR